MLKNLSAAELEDIAADEFLDYDIRIEATKEIMQRGRMTDGFYKTERIE